MRRLRRSQTRKDPYRRRQESTDIDSETVGSRDRTPGIRSRIASTMGHKCPSAPAGLRPNPRLIKNYGTTLTGHHESDHHLPPRFNFHRHPVKTTSRRRRIGGSSNRDPSEATRLNKNLETGPRPEPMTAPTRVDSRWEPQVLSDDTKAPSFGSDLSPGGRRSRARTGKGDLTSPSCHNLDPHPRDPHREPQNRETLLPR